MSVSLAVAGRGIVNGAPLDATGSAVASVEIPGSVWRELSLWVPWVTTDGWSVPLAAMAQLDTAAGY